MRSLKLTLAVVALSSGLAVSPIFGDSLVSARCAGSTGTTVGSAVNGQEIAAAGTCNGLNDYTGGIRAGSSGQHLCVKYQGMAYTGAGTGECTYSTSWVLTTTHRDNDSNGTIELYYINVSGFGIPIGTYNNFGF
jgi:hypothetical protein